MKRYLKVPPHLKRVATLPCEMVALKNAMTKSWVKRTAAQDSTIQNSFAEKYSSSVISIISVYWRQDIYNGHT